jgi:hypothetical protein
MKHLPLSIFASVAVALVSMPSSSDAQISFTGTPYTQDFNGMGTAGTTAPTGWTVDSITNTAASGTSTDAPATTGLWSASTATLTGANDGTGATNGSYNFGTTSSTERALGSTAGSGTQKDTYVAFSNNTGSSITQFSISYDGEQWRLGQAASAVNLLTLQYSADGSTWVNMGSQFNFTSPITTGTAGALDGNASANRVAGIGGTFAPSAAITNGSNFFIRWADPDDGGSDNGMAIDNFTLSIIPEPTTSMLLGLGLLLGVQRLRRKTS